GVGQVLLAALVQRGNGLVERELAELHGEVAGVVLNGRDVVDGLAQAALLGVGQPGERAALNVNQVWDVDCLIQAREASARPESVCSSQEMTPSEGDTRAEEGAEARPAKIVQVIGALKGCRCSRTPTLDDSRMWRDAGTAGRLRLSTSAVDCTGKCAIMN